MTLAARIPPPFPLADSHAWLRPEDGRPDPVEVRIVQHDHHDGMVRVSALGTVYPHERATAIRRVSMAELAESYEKALRPARRARPRKRTK